MLTSIIALIIVQCIFNSYIPVMDTNYIFILIIYKLFVYPLDSNALCKYFPILFSVLTDVEDIKEMNLLIFGHLQ